MNGKILFRADASKKIGGGHILRCLSLANVFFKAGWEIIFASRPSTIETVSALNSSGYEYIELDCLPEKEPLVLFDSLPNGCDILVVDHYLLDSKFESTCRAWAKQILVIDDLANCLHDCDFILNSSLGFNRQSYQTLVPDNCQFLLGPKYALLRSGFVTLRQKSIKLKEQNLSVKRIFVSFGLMDNKDFCTRTLKALGNVDNDITVDVVIGSSAPHIEKLEGYVKNSSFPVKLHKDLKDMAGVMTKADFAIGACGSTAWERCCLGLPSLIVITADNQSRIANALKKNGIVETIGWHEDITSNYIREHIVNFIKNNDKRKNMIKKASLICDGLGSIRVALNLVPHKFSKDLKPVRLRLADISDADLIFSWQINKQTRKYFNNPEAPQYMEHMGWMENSILNSKRFLSLILYDREPVGVLRLDCEDDEKSAEVSIFIIPSKKKLGVGKAALAFVFDFFPSLKLYAQILPENMTSKAFFIKSGFVQIKENMFVHNPKS